MTKQIIRWDIAKSKELYFLCRKCHIKFYYSNNNYYKDITNVQRNEHEKTCNGIKPEEQKEMSKQKGLNFMSNEVW